MCMLLNSSVRASHQSHPLTTIKTPSQPPFPPLSSHFKPSLEIFSTYSEKALSLSDNIFYVFFAFVLSSVSTFEEILKRGPSPHKDMGRAACSKQGIYHMKKKMHENNLVQTNTAIGLSWWLSGQAEKAMAPHSSTLAWKIPWTEEPGRLQSMGS